MNSIRNFLHECGTLRSPNCYGRDFSRLDEDTKGMSAYQNATNVFNPLADMLASPLSKNSKDGKTKLMWPTSETKPYRFYFKYNQNSLDLVEHELKQIAFHSNLANYIKMESGKNKDGSRDIFTLTFTDEEEVNPKKTIYKFLSSSGRSGSAGGNKGNAFETQFTNELNSYISGEGSLSSENSSAIQALYNVLGLHKPSDIVGVSNDGGLNQKRPLHIDNKSVLIGGKTGDIGKEVTDITLTDSKNKKHYLSLKYGESCVLANIGLRKYFDENEIRAGNIENKQAQTLLNMLGINEKWFCEVFNAYVEKRKHKEELKIKAGQWIPIHVDDRMFKDFIASGIGYGFLWVHHFGNHTHIIDMRTRQDLEKVIGNNIKAFIRYPNPSNKTITIKVELHAMIINIVIRHNTGKVYPNVINFNYTIKH